MSSKYATLPKDYANADIYAWMRDECWAWLRGEITREQYMAERAFLSSLLK